MTFDALEVRGLYQVPMYKNYRIDRLQDLLKPVVTSVYDDEPGVYYWTEANGRKWIICKHQNEEV